MTTLFHSFDVLTGNGKGLVGYQVLVRGVGNGPIQPIYADSAMTPIYSVSGLNNTALTDNAGNWSFFVVPGSYDLEFRDPNGTYLKTVSNATLLSGQNGDQGDPGPSGPANSTYTTLAALQAAPSTNVSYNFAPPSGSDGGVGAGAFFFQPGDFTGRTDVVALNSVPISQGALVRASSRNYLSVREFGAVGDGVADDRARIQAAIDFVAAQGGGAVFIPVGTFRMTFALAEDGGGVSCLTLRNGVELIGENRFASVLILASGMVGPGTYFRGIATNGQVSSVVLRDFTFDGNRGGQGAFKPQGNGGNIVINAKLCTIDGVFSREANGQCIQVRGSPSSPVDRLTITNCIADGASGATVNSDGSIAAQNNGNGIGIQVSQATDYTIEGNSIRNCVDNGIDTYNESGTSVPTGGSGRIVNNTITFSRCGIFPETSARIIVANNSIKDIVEAGIAINRISSAPDMMLVCGNVVEYCPVLIRVSGNSASLRISDNFLGFVTMHNGAGVYLTFSSQVQVTGNTFKIEYTDVPLVAMVGSQSVFSLIAGNYYYNNPNPGLLTYTAPGTDIYGTVIDDWRAVDAVFARANNEGQLYRPYAYIDHLGAGSSSLGQVGFNGVAPQGKITLPAAPTDAASTQAVAAAVRQLLISFGLGA
jgi:hypothetical protein